MTKTILYVHGGGVREAAFDRSFRFLQQTLLTQGITHTLAPCFWGDAHGSKPPSLCIPQLGNNPKRLTEEQKVAHWNALYRDPFSELHMLKIRSDSQNRASQPPGPGIWTLIEAYRPSAGLNDFLEKWQMTPCWDRAWRSIVVDDKTALDVLYASGQNVGEPVEAIGRGIVARLTNIALSDDLPVLDSKNRDALVNLLMNDWVGRDGGVNLHVGRSLMDIRISSSPQSARPADANTAAVGDVLLYQARGSAIRETIRRAIDRTAGADKNSEAAPIVLLAHSLGGVACVDLLAANELAYVTHLITVGSQAPYLYEIGALPSLDISRNERLPPSFPPWLNLYDPNDFLSYVAEPVFQTAGICDVCIDSGQPFPEAHGAYWTNDATWCAVKEFIAKVRPFPKPLA
jgi:hypothetical protein